MLYEKISSGGLEVSLSIVPLLEKGSFAPQGDKICLRGFGQSVIQTSLLSFRD